MHSLNNMYSESPSIIKILLAKKNSLKYGFVKVSIFIFATSLSSKVFLVVENNCFTLLSIFKTRIVLFKPLYRSTKIGECVEIIICNFSPAISYKIFDNSLTAIGCKKTSGSSINNK